MPKRCEEMDKDGFRCPNRARYGYSKIGCIIYCKFHKKDGMTTIQKRPVCYCDKARPSFGFSTDKVATCCASCKLEGMENIMDKKCYCGKARPSFGFSTDNTASRCVSCKSEGMRNIKDKKCYCGQTQPHYGYRTDQKATRCILCKLDGMVDIRSRRCFCRKSLPSFGFIGDKNPTRCSLCKLEGMENIRGKKCFCGKTGPRFGFLSDKATHCSSCKIGGMENIRDKKCKANETHNILCPLYYNKYYNGYCTHCFAHLFPHHPKTQGIRKKSKELQVRDFINAHYDGFVHDKPLYVDLEGGCCASKRRIDLRKLIGNTLLCIEIDENQHKNYNKVDEKIRYNDLFIDYSGKYIFIRYNPDVYKRNGRRSNPKFETRMDRLVLEIEKHIQRINNEENEELVEINKLFYDM